jgi:cytochrome c553
MTRRVISIDAGGAMSIHLPAHVWRVVAMLFLGVAFVISAAAANVDHGKFDILKGPFKPGPDITKACLSCHTDVAKQVQTLVVPHLFGADADAYWKSYDWGRALAAGMKAAGLPYSGQFGWVETEYSWPITHMVAPKGKALTCMGCHAPEGRLKDVPGLKMPCFTC